MFIGSDIHNWYCIRGRDGMRHKDRFVKIHICLFHCFRPLGKLDNLYRKDARRTCLASLGDIPNLRLWDASRMIRLFLHEFRRRLRPSLERKMRRDSGISEIYASFLGKGV